MSEIHFIIDGKACTARAGMTILEAAKSNGVYIPALCSYDGMKPTGSCRICTVKVGGRNMAACHTPVTQGMVVENAHPELEDMRKALLEMLFVEGNHMCPTCEKSGNCELQAMAYRYRIMAPRFPFLWPVREIDASTPKIYLDTNRCIQCLRCVKGAVTSDGKHIFGLVNRGGRTLVKVDGELGALMSDDEAQRAMDMCPVGAIIHKEVGFTVPIGKRKFDSKPIGSDIGE
jgi:[NiFe] hydrogenase diaphorase moiety small subunit